MEVVTIKGFNQVTVTCHQVLVFEAEKSQIDAQMGKVQIQAGGCLLGVPAGTGVQQTF